MLTPWFLLAILGSNAFTGQTVERSPLALVSPGWNQWASVGPSASSVTRIVPDPSSGEVVYCLSQGRVFKTVDAGDRWVRLNLESILADIAIDPSDSDVLLAVPLGVPNAVFKSTDAGVTWSPRSLSASVSSPKRILWDGGRPNRVFFLAFNAVVRSLDAGESWDLLTPSVPGSVTALALDSTSGALFAASSVGIFRLDVDASSWIQLAGPLPSGPVIEVDIDPVRPNVLYAITAGGFPRVFRSPDGGRSWTTPDLEIGTPGVTSLVVDPLHPDVLYGVGGFGIVRSQDGGVSWSDYSAGFNSVGQSVFVQTLALSPTGTLFAGSGAGMFRRAPDDPAWTAVNAGLAPLPILRIAAGASPDGPVYAATAVSVWLSENAGLTWSFSPLTLSAAGTSVLTADPSTVGTAYWGFQGCAPRPPYPCYGGVYKTSDGGQHWQGLQTPSGLGAVQAFAVDPGRPQRIFVAGYMYGPSENLGFRSADGGVTWEQLASGFPTDGVSRILVDLRRPDSIYVGTSHGVFRSTDGGASWSATSLGNVAVTALVEDARSGTLYAGSDLGLFYSEDAGATWTPRLTPGGVLALAVDPRSGAVYGATTNAGVQESLDGGRAWSALGPGLSGVSVSDLALSPGGSILYAATNKGVYEFRFRGLRAVQPR